MHQDLKRRPQRRTAAAPRDDSSAQRWSELDNDAFFLTQVAISAWLGAGIAGARAIEAHRRIWAQSFA